MADDRMPDTRTSHAAHDTLLIAALAADDLTGAARSDAETRLAACPECAALHADLVAIAAATTALPAPARPRSFTLAPEQAARLAPSPWRRLLAGIGGPTGFARPLAATFTTLGIAGLLLTALPSLGSFGVLGGSGAAHAGTRRTGARAQHGRQRGGRIGPHRRRPPLHRPRRAPRPRAVEVARDSVAPAYGAVVEPKAEAATEPCRHGRRAAVAGGRSRLDAHRALRARRCWSASRCWSSSRSPAGGRATTAAMEPERSGRRPRPVTPSTASPDTRTSHAAHDTLLIAALAADDLTGAARSDAETRLAACPECAALHADLVAIAAATTALPAPARPRSFTLAPEQAARLAPSPWRRLLAGVGGPTGFARPLAATSRPSASPGSSSPPCRRSARSASSRGSSAAMPAATAGASDSSARGTARSRPARLAIDTTSTPPVSPRSGRTGRPSNRSRARAGAVGKRDRDGPALIELPASTNRGCRPPGGIADGGERNPAPRPRPVPATAGPRPGRHPRDQAAGAKSPRPRPPPMPAGPGCSCSRSRSSGSVSGSSPPVGSAARTDVPDDWPRGAATTASAPARATLRGYTSGIHCPAEIPRTRRCPG